jgi:hypothetical protein
MSERIVTTPEDPLRAAARKFIAWQYRERGAQRFTMTDLRAALAAPPVAGAEAEAEWTSLYDELMESPLPGARYAYTVVHNHEAALRATAPALDVGRLADALRTDVVQDVVRRWMPTDQTSHVAHVIAREYAALKGASGE